MRDTEHNPGITGGGGFRRLGIVLATVVLITAAVFWQTRKAQLTKFRMQFESDAAARAALVMQEVDKSLLAIKSLGWFLEGAGNVDGKKFKEFATATLRERNDLRALSWNPRVTASERASFEAKARREGLGEYRLNERGPDGTLMAARERGTYYPAFYVEPLQGNEAVVGFDVGSEAVRLTALEQACDTGEPTVTEPIQLVQKAGCEPGFLIFVPVYREGMPKESVEERRAGLEGFALGFYQVETLVSTALRGVEPVGLTLAFHDRSAPVGRQMIYYWEYTRQDGRSWKSILYPASPRVTETFPFAGRQWSLEMLASPAYMARYCPIAYWLVLPGGFLVGLVTLRYIRSLQTNRERLELLVAERTAELCQAQERYRAVVEYSPDGMAVSVDKKLVYVNPTAVRLMGAREAADLLGHSVLEFVHEDFREEVVRRLTKMHETGLPAPAITGKLRRLDGGIMEADFMGVPIVFGGKPAILSSFRDMTEHHRRAQALQAIVKATGGSGEQFFRALVAELGKVLGVKYALASVLMRGAPEPRVRTVALWSHGAIVENCDYELKGTPCVNVVGKELRHYPRDMQRLFPCDTMLADLKVESYLGIPLNSSSGAPLGHLCVMDDQPMPNSELATSLMTIFAARAASELEREEALECLRASEARYRQLHESMRDAFAGVDLNGCITDYNETFRQMLGYEREEMRALTYQDITPEKWHAIEAEIIEKQVRERGYSDIYEKEYRRKDGTEFPVELRVILLQDDAGKPYGMWAIVRDITKRKQAEETLRQRVEELEIIMGSAPVALWVAHDPKCDYIWGNQMASSFDEVSPQTNWSANVSSKLRWFRDGRQLNPEELPMQQAARKNTAIHNAEMELLLPSGKRVSLLGSAMPLRDAQGRVRGCVGAFLDNTGRKQAESLLAGEKRVLEWIALRRPLPAVLNEICRFIEELVPGAMCSILLLDADGTRLWPVAASNLPEEWTRAITPLAIGPAVGSCGAAAWGNEQVVVSDIANDHSWTDYPDYCALALKCGLRACWSTPILAAEGEVLGTFAMYYQEPRSPRERDLEVIKQVTHLASVAIEHDRAAEGLRRARDELEERVRERTAELVRANERLEEMDRLKSQFLATMSHELRTPLNSIIGFTGILRQGFAGPVNDEQKKQLGLVFGSAKHLLSLINDLLDLSRIEAGKVELEQEPFNFVEVIDEVVQSLTPMARQKNLNLATDLPGPAIEMVGDRKRSFQVLLNLANNAVKFTNQGEVKITAGTEGDKLRVCVADTGIGIKPEQMGMLFEAFRQLDGTAKRIYEGTGLGLHLCRRLLTLMNGEISVESEFGKGSRFSFTMPRRAGERTAFQREGL